MAPWPSGKAKVCNTSIPGPIPGGASKKDGYPNGYPSFLPFSPLHWTRLCALARRIRFAISAKRRSVLAQDLADEISAKSLCSTAPSGWHPIGVLFLFCQYYSSSVLLRNPPSLRGEDFVVGLPLKRVVGDTCPYNNVQFVAV